MKYTVFNWAAPFLTVVLINHGIAQSPPVSLSGHLHKKQGFTGGTVYSITRDHLGFMWYGCSDGLYRYDGYEHIQYRHEVKNPNSISDSFVTCVLEDSKGYLWVGTLSGGLNKFDPATNTFKSFRNDPADSSSIQTNYVSDLAEDKNGNIWVTAGRLSMLNQVSNKFIHINNIGVDRWDPVEVFSDSDGILWIGYNREGFSRLDLKTKKFENFRISHADPNMADRSNVIRSFAEDRKGNIWIGTYGGLARFEKKSRTITHWTHNDADVNSLVHNSIWSLEVGADDKVWIATWGGGISCLDTKTGLFENASFRPGGIYAISNMELPSVYLDPNGVLWFGSNGAGIFKLKPLAGLSQLPKADDLIGKRINKIVKGQQFTYFLSETSGVQGYSQEHGITFTLSPNRDGKANGLSGNRISSLSEVSDGTIFVGTDHGLTQYNPVTKISTHFLNNPNDTTTLRHNTIITTYVDSHDQLWISTPYGLSRLDRTKNRFTTWRKPKITATTVVSLGETSEGLWLGTGTSGLDLFSPENGLISNFQFNEKNDSSINNNYVRVIKTDKAGNLWVGTANGLGLFNPTYRSFRRIFIEGSGDQQSIRSLVDGPNQSLIVENGERDLYEVSAGGSMIKRKYLLPANNELPALWSPTEKRLYLFAEKQIAFISIDSIRQHSTVSPIVITKFALDPNNKHPFDSVTANLNMAYVNSISLNHDQNLFSIEFAALDFFDPASNQYAYKLDGFDEDWTYSGTRRFVTYTNLSPGNYIFRAKGTNHQGVWNENGTSLKIIILSPPWKTWWAYTGYSLAFLGLLYMGRQVIVNRERLKAQVTLEQKEKQTLKELDNLKTKFFSNITHEFRTPLTLIQGPANELLEKTNDSGAHQLLHMIKNNAGRLLTLINQLLDLARLDASEMKLNLHPVRLDSLLTTTISQFTSLATAKNIRLEWVIPEKEITVLADEEKMDTILINLISNALKFTPSGGHVVVIATIQSKLFEVEVKDNGRGIPLEKIPHIFDRFYQVEATDSSHAEGTGIGLALVKEYVELMKGIIHVESNVGVGTSIKVSITLETTTPQSATIKKLPEEDNLISEEVSNGNEALPTLLIVEDNADIRLFIKTCLGSHYRYSEAVNGREGLEKARNEIPDLIISDLMMPEMDGLELCTAIKKDDRTNHIPFIMLTAKAAEENKLEGLQTGADDYLTKPFNKAELALKVQNLVVLREKLQAHMKKHLLSQSTPVEATSAAEQFIVKARTFIEAHLSDETLNVEMLAAELNLGREQCYRKIIALTGFAPSAFIRKLRLQKAAHLLGTKWGPVSQVAYEVGFGNLSYFSKAFKEEFGKLPSEY